MSHFNDKIKQTAVYTSRNELLFFLNFLDTNLKIQKFLQYDHLFYLADKYLIAMVFIYFKRARLSHEDYTSLSFFAALCLAHAMEEDIELSLEIYPWALGDKVKDLLPKLIELKILLWEAMDYRAAVSQHCCMKLISISHNHPVWQRNRAAMPLSSLPSNGVFQTIQDVPNEKEDRSFQRKQQILP